MTPPFPHPTGRQLPLRHGDQQAVAVEVGAGLRRYALGEWDVLDGYAADEPCTGGRGQLLAPWPNRLRDGRHAFGGVPRQLALTEPGAANAIHGLVRWSPWTVVEQAEQRVGLEHRLHPQPGWPWPLDLRVDYVLGPEGLTVRTTATNPGREPCPFGVGAHPYLRVGPPPVDDALLQAPGAVRLLADARGIPTGSAPVDGTPYDFRAPRPLGALRLDTAFTELARDPDGRARVHLSAPDGSRHATLWMDERYRWLMLFTGDTLPDRDERRRSLGVEPMTCAPNALQSGDGLIVLEPGERWSAEWGLTATTTPA